MGEARCEIHRSLRTESERETTIRLPAADAAVLAELDAPLRWGNRTMPATSFPPPSRWLRRAASLIARPTIWQAARWARSSQGSML